MGKSKLTKPEVLHIAQLSALPLTEKELTKFQDQLSEVLEFVESLAKVKTENITPTSQVTGLTNVIRPDEPGSCLSQGEALSGAAEKEGGYFVVEKVLHK